MIKPTHLSWKSSSLKSGSKRMATSSSPRQRWRNCPTRQQSCRINKTHENTGKRNRELCLSHWEKCSVEPQAFGSWTGFILVSCGRQCYSFEFLVLTYWVIFRTKGPQTLLSNWRVVKRFVKFFERVGFTAMCRYACHMTHMCQYAFIVMWRKICSIF